MASSRRWHAHPPTSSQVSSERTPLVDDLPRWVALLSITEHGRFLTFFLAGVRFHTDVSRCAAGCSETPCAARSGNRTGYSIPNPAEILVSELGTVSCAANYGGIAQVSPTPHAPSFVPRTYAPDRFRNEWASAGSKLLRWANRLTALSLH